MDYGAPQGGPLPWEDEWSEAQCPRSSMSGKLPQLQATSSCDQLESSGASVEVLRGTTPLLVEYLPPAPLDSALVAPAANLGMRFNSALCIDAEDEGALRLHSDGTPLSAATYSELRQETSCPRPSRTCSTSESILFSSRSVALEASFSNTGCSELRSAWRSVTVTQASAVWPLCDRTLRSAENVSIALCEPRAADVASFTKSDSHLARLVYAFDGGSFAGEELSVGVNGAQAACVLFDGVEHDIYPSQSARAAIPLWKAQQRVRHTLDVLVYGRAGEMPAISLQPATLNCDD